MSIEDNTPVDTGFDETPEVSLDDFSAEFFGQNDAAPEPASLDEEVDVEAEEVSAPEDDDTQPEDTDESEDTTDEEEAEEAPKPKKKQTAQERINEVVAQRREAERLLEAALDEISKLRNSKTDEPSPTKEVAKGPVGPTPDDLNEDGTEKYPLGQFDPSYISDLTRFTLQQERDALKAQDAIEAARAAQDQEVAELEASWAEKLGPAQERYPDFQEKGMELMSTFDGIDQMYGEYLEATIMSMDNGPDVLYYLASNPDLAQEIVNSGARKATIALGRLDAKFAVEEQEQVPTKKVSKAPAPPPVNKGSAPSANRVAPDTDDLEAFSADFFKPKRR